MHRPAYLFGSIRVGGFASHKVEEGIKEDVAAVVGIHDGHDALEVNVSLLVLAQRVAQADEARFEFVRLQMARAVLVKVVERAAEFVQLLLRDA